MSVLNVEKLTGVNLDNLIRDKFAEHGVENQALESKMKDLIFYVSELMYNKMKPSGITPKTKESGE